MSVKAIKRKPLSEKAKAALLTGQLLWKCECTSQLINFLEEENLPVAAANLRQIYSIARSIAYAKGRKAIEEANKDV